MTVTFVTLSLGSNITMIGSVLFIGVATAIICARFNAMPPEILGHSKAGIGFGVINVCFSLGAVLSVPLIGF